MKKLIILALLNIYSVISYSQDRTYLLSSHILDISMGKPAPGVPVKLEHLDTKTGAWTFTDQKKTDSNGRIPNFLVTGKTEKGIYRLTFLTNEYFHSRNIESFYPFIEVVFKIGEESHYHVPITLSPYGYSTYRGN